MRISCIVDDVNFSKDICTHMPLSELIHQRKIGSEGLYCRCAGRKCLNCLCFMEDSSGLNGERDLLPSCMIPAYKADGKKITTADYFLSTEDAGDVFDAYRLLKLNPCQSCFSAKTMIFSYIASEYLNFENHYSGVEAKDYEARKSFLIRTNMNLSSCSCLSMKSVSSIVEMAIKIRRNRNV